MRIAAGILGLLYGVVHGINASKMLDAPSAARGSGEAGAIPKVARILWVLLVAVCAFAAGALLFVDADVVGALLAIGVLGIALLAIANGVWMHGRPTWGHHAVRAVFVLAVLVPAALGSRLPGDAAVVATVAVPLLDASALALDHELDATSLRA